MHRALAALIPILPAQLLPPRPAPIAPTAAEGTTPMGWGFWLFAALCAIALALWAWQAGARNARRAH